MRKMTGRKLRKLAKAYFDGLRYEKPVLERRVILETRDGRQVARLDEYGHELYEFVPVRTADGTEYMATAWAGPPTIDGLCKHLKINRTTFWRWLHSTGQSEEDAALRAAAQDAWSTIKEYLETESLTNPKAARGALANLKANFWLPEDQGETAAPAVVLTMSQRKDILRQMGLRLPGEEDNDDE